MAESDLTHARFRVTATWSPGEKKGRLESENAGLHRTINELVAELDLRRRDGSALQRP